MVASLLEALPEQPMTIADVASTFRVHRRTVEKWMQAGLESFWLGGQRYILPQAIAAFARPVSREQDRTYKRGTAAHKQAAKEQFERIKAGIAR